MLHAFSHKLQEQKSIVLSELIASHTKKTRQNASLRHAWIEHLYFNEANCYMLQYYFLFLIQIQPKNDANLSERAADSEPKHFVNKSFQV